MIADALQWTWIAATFLLLGCTCPERALLMRSARDQEPNDTAAFRYNEGRCGEHKMAANCYQDTHDGLGEEFLDDAFDADEPFRAKGDSCKQPGPYKLGIAWQPQDDLPVTMLAVKVHGSQAFEKRVFALEDTYDDSPAIFTLPYPDREGVFTVEWAIVPEVEIDRIVISVLNCADHSTALVAATKDLARGELWRNPDREVTIHAPHVPPELK